MNAPVEPWVWDIAAFGLDPGRPIAVEGPWGPRLAKVFDHGLAGLLAAAADQDAVHLDPGARAQVLERVAMEASLGVRLEAEIARLAPVFERHRAVVLKGAALAHGAYPDPRWRPFSDIDLLVSGDSVGRALADLERLGYARPRPDPTPGYAARIAKATAVVHPSGLIVDLHRTMVAGAAGHGIDVAEVLTDRIDIAAGRVTVPAPSWAAHLVEVCLHAAVGDRFARALSLRDVAQVANHPALDPVQALALASRWGVHDLVVVALRAARALVAAPLPGPLAAVVPAPDPTTSFVPVEQQVASARSRVDELRHGALRHRSALLRALLAPSPTFLRWTYGPAPLPRLYLRRWSDLRHRRTDALPVR